MTFMGLLLPIVFENQSPQSSGLGRPRCVWLSRNSSLPILCRHQVARTQSAWCLAPHGGTQPETCLLGRTFCSGLRTLGPTQSTNPSCCPSSVLASQLQLLEVHGWPLCSSRPAWEKSFGADPAGRRSPPLDSNATASGRRIWPLAAQLECTCPIAWGDVPAGCHLSARTQGLWWVRIDGAWVVGSS